MGGFAGGFWFIPVKRTTESLSKEEFCDPCEAIAKVSEPTKFNVKLLSLDNYNCIGT